MIPLFKVYMAKDVEKFVLPILHSGYIGEGEKTKLFEMEFGKFINKENVVLVNSGTSSIMMALKLAGVTNGDKVLSTPMTCLATNMAILAVGAIPVWVDILFDGTMNVESLEDKITGQEKAIICMDWGGTPCQIDEISNIGKKYDIPVIEDACQSLGSIYKGSHVGGIADYTCFSFQAIKQLTTVDGGALVIKDSSFVEKAKMMRWFGLDRTQGADMRCNQDPPVAGYKWQSNDVAASIGLANLVGLEDRIEITQRHAKKYNEAFEIETDEDRESGYWLYTIYIDDVDMFILYMKENGVECSRVHDRNDTKTIFKNSMSVLNGVDMFDKYHVCIPVGWWLSDSDVEKIINLVKEYKS